MTDHSAAEEAEFAKVVGSGRQFAERVRLERQRRGWSQAELSRQMRAIGQPLDQAAISKIESPPESDRVRRIDIDEAIAFAKVFNLSLEQMTLPMLRSDELQVLALLAEASELRERYNRAQSEYEQAVRIVALGTRVMPNLAAHFDARRSAAKDQWEADFLADVVTFLEDDGEQGFGEYLRRHVDLEEDLAVMLQHRAWTDPSRFVVRAQQRASDD